MAHGSQSHWKGHYEGNLHDEEAESTNDSTAYVRTTFTSSPLLLPQLLLLVSRFLHRMVHV